MNSSVTDDAMVVETMLNKKVRLVEGSRVSSHNLAANPCLPAPSIRRKQSDNVLFLPELLLLALCTDNAAMIGAAAYYEYLAGRRDGWDLNAVPNLKLGER